MRSQRFWINILAVALLGLSFVIILLERKDAAAVIDQQLLESEAATDIIIRTSKDQVVLQKKNDDWFMQQPQQSKASNDRIGPLLSLLHLPQRPNYSIADVSLGELGLKPPRAVVTINSIEFSFGNLTTEGNARYVLVRDRIHLFNEMVFPLISAGPSALLPQPG